MEDISGALSVNSDALGSARTLSELWQHPSAQAWLRERFSHSDAILIGDRSGILLPDLYDEVRREFECVEGCATPDQGDVWSRKSRSPGS